MQILLLFLVMVVELVPEIVIKSALAFTTPAATIPTPGSQTSFTDTKAAVLSCLRS
jgi:hypothetical protein